MAQRSYPWDGQVLGDATEAPYSSAEWQSKIYRYLLSANREKGGPIRGFLNQFAATNTTSPIAIDTGASLVDGTIHESDASENIVIPNPIGNPRMDRIVLLKNPTTQTVRLVRSPGAEAAVPVAPALDQTDLANWEDPLWQVYIDVAGNITLYDDYNFVTSPLNSIGLAQGRLSLLWDNPDTRDDLDAVAPASTDHAVTDTVTFAVARLYNTGQAIQVSATGNGLTQNQIYYVRTADNLTYSFHNNLSDAKRNLNKVNLTGNIEPNTLYSGAIYYTRYNGDGVDVKDTQYGWNRLRVPDDALMLDITLFAAGTNFDVFITEDKVLEVASWAHSTLRTTEVIRTGAYDGVLLKSGSPSRRYLGSIRTTSTLGQIIDTEVYRYVVNMYNRILKRLFVCPAFNKDGASTSYVLGSVPYVDFNGGTDNKLHYLAPFQNWFVSLQLDVTWEQATDDFYAGIGFDGITLPRYAQFAFSGVNMKSFSVSGRNFPGQGYHNARMVGRTSAGNNATIYADSPGAPIDDPYATNMSGWIEV